ncbi:pericentrin isoform X5 [Ahaetulla prasina]|uniref:pericentrin isoform X5 n=1 Tax=Ahaetulla prasina TaxID=499056 RepID=UPI002648538D|nr:pericentrin isoform X5 [Ahaetulla prasina]
MEEEDSAGVREAAGSLRASPQVQEQEQNYDIGEFLKCQDENKNLHAKLMEEQKQLLEDLQQKVEATLQGELQQAEVPDNLKLEAIRLSSNNICTSQMELMQMNLTKEKETALMELREMLNDKHAQEIAVLQSRYHFELEHINKQNQKEKEEMVLKHQLEMDEMKEKSLEMEEKHLNILENLKKEWVLNVDVSLKNVSEELSVKHQTELNKLKQNLTAETEELKKKMNTLSLEKRQIEMEHKNLENKYHLAMKTLQSKHENEMQDIKEQNKKQVEELQQEIQKLKAELEEELAQLWSQLDGARASRQELSELKIQLLARTSHVEELEYLKKDYQLKWDKKKTEHETELEQLRLYFEQKLKSVEENYREELTMLHQRLQEVKDYSIEEMEKSQERDMEFGPSVTLLEEMTERERLDLFEQLTQQLEHYKEELCSLQLRLDKKHLHEIELLRSTLTLQYQENIVKLKLELSDRYTSEIEQLKKKHCLHLEQLHAKISEEHLKEITKIRQQSTQDAARQIETEVAQRLLLLENEYKNDLGCLQLEMQSISSQQEEIEELKRKNTELKEIGIVQEKNVKEELEQIKHKLIEDHTAELRRTRKLLQEMEQTHKAEAEEWRHEKKILIAESEEKILLLRKELQNKAQYEKQTWQRQSDLREAEMTCLQEQQAALIVELEKTLKEQQNTIQQLEDSLENTQKTLAQYNSELSFTKTLMAEELEKAKQVLEEEYKAKYKEAQSRFLEENKKTRTEHEILLQKLREKHIDELELQNKELHQKHKEHILSLTSTQQAEIEVLKSALEKKQQNWLETPVADIQRNNQAHITQLETKHLSDLNSLEATYLFKIKFLQEEHKKALGGLQIKLKEQLFQKDKENEMLLAQELNTIKFAEELPICEDNLKIELADVQKEKHKLMAAEHEDVHKEELTVALETQRPLFEDEHYEALDVLQKTILQMEEEHKRTIQGFQDLHLVEIEKGKKKIQQLQKELEKIKSDKQQLENEVFFLKKEMEKSNTELKKLYPHETENQEENILIAMLRSDIDSYRNERDKLQESCQQALKLLLKMVQSTKDMEDLICKKIGLCLDDSLGSGESQEIISEETVLAHPLKTIGKWKLKKNNRICQGEVPDQTLLEHSFDSLELSEHLCESIFENPELIFENEERIKKIGRCLYITVEKLLDMLAESTKQLEEMHNIHTNIKEECKNKNWEACQMFHEQHELMDCFNEESKVQNQLVLELHKAKGLIEGYLTERHTLEEALNLKEESEHRLVAELEKLKAQIQKLTQHNARFAEEQKLLISQNRALAANVGEREVELIKEIERLAKTNLELQCQAEKDCSNFNAQMKILEIELEDQLNKNQNLAAMASEVTDLRQQMEALERQLKNQRDFMDKQAIEREHERDEFQEEIQKLEMELKFITKSQASGKSRTYLVESLHNEIKERVDDYNRLFTEKEQIEKLLSARNEEIEKLEGQVRELQCLNKEMAKNVDKYMQELEKVKKTEIELKEDKGTLQQQHNKNLILISTLQSKLDEVRYRVLTDTNEDHMLKEQLKIQEELTTKEREVADLLEQLEKFKDNLMNKNKEILQLRSKLEVEKNANINKLIQLKEENAYLKENIEKLAIQCQNPGENELVILQFLKSLLEEKNQETDHLNEQIERLEQKIESSKENELKIPMENDQDNYQGKVACPKTLDVDAFFPSEEKEKGGEERDSNNMLSASADFSFPLEEDTVTNLQISSRNPNIHNKQLQDIPFIQRKQTDHNEVQQNLKLLLKNMWQSNQDFQNSQISQTIPNCFQNIIMNKTLWDSPENMRKENQSLEFQASLSLTPFSEVDVMHSIAFESLCSENSIIQEDTPRVLECPVSYSSEDAAVNPDFLSSVFSEPTSSVNKCNGLQENVSVNNTEVFSLIPPELQDGLKVTMSRLQSASTEYGSNTSLDLILQLNQTEPENKVCQNSHVMAPLQCFGMTPDVTAPTVKETEMMSQQLKTVLKMVYDESYKILVLSEKPLPLDDGDKIQQGPSVEGWQRERLNLVDIIQSLKNHLKQSNKENKEEQQPKRVVEHLSFSDRNSLLSDMQDLEVQLRLTQLQNQEKLQELQETLINTENHGKKQEQQVELLEYKLQQQQSISNDLQAFLKHEQEKASEMHELLKQEHTAILNLKSDLCESKQTNERLEKSLQDTQNEVIKYSSALENKERSITAALENLQREHLKNIELQIKLDEQQKQHKIKEDEKSKAIEELQAALELQCIQNNQLTVALEHEQSANSNLRKELQIEHSRCEALLSKDQNKLLELQKNLDIEKKQNADMLTALNHERVLTEHLTMRLNECGSCKHKDSLQELQAQLHLERSNSMKLLAIIEKSQQQIFDSKKQMEEMHLHCKDFQQEQAVQNTVQVTGSMMQNKKQDDVHTLEVQRDKEAQTKVGSKQLQSAVKPTREQEIRTVQGERKMAQEQQTECHCLRTRLEAQENQNESTLQYLHNCVRFKELQQMLEDLKNQEILLKKYNQFPSKNNYANLTFTTDTVSLHVEQQILENIREQLVLVAAYLSEFIYKAIDKTINWSASNDEIVAALLHILELKELLASSKPVVIPTSIIHSVQASDGYIYQDKHGLQNDLKATNYAATKTNVPENKQTVISSSPKIQKLYRKYLRAESFRKALVYQKKYLLLLLGGFQECEQATLSLIARMGIYPSPPDLNVSETRSHFFTKFRSAVRVVIAILRLKFLVRKWHKVNKKEMPLEAISSSLGRNSYPVASLEVLKQQQQSFPSHAAPGGEYCNRNNLMSLASCTVKSLHHLHNRSTSFISQTSSKDPEDSLSEYIAHLEAIQERLGILLPAQLPLLSPADLCHQGLGKAVCDEHTKGQAGGTSSAVGERRQGFSGRGNRKVSAGLLKGGGVIGDGQGFRQR